MNLTQKRNIYKEPLLHFILIGTALFLIFDWKGKPVQFAGGPSGIPAAQITVSVDAVDRMKSQFEKTWQRPATAEEEKAFVEELVRNEIFYREAIAIGLDRDDEVLKRRMRQKMEFIYEDISSWVEPSDADLMAFMKKHREKYLTDLQFSFRQVFINVAKHGKNAESEARQALSLLASGNDPDGVGDPTMLAAEVQTMPLREIILQFGETFAKSLLALKPGAWAGPVKSVYGLHLVLVNERQDRHLPDLKDVRETVKRDWLVEKQKELKDAAYAKIRERYTVIVEKPKSTSAQLSSAAKGSLKVR